MTKKKHITFKNDDQKAILREWWKNLSRGSKAELRRCSSPEEVAVLGAFHELRFRLISVSSAHVDLERLALVAGLSAHVKQDESSQTIGQQMAGCKQGSTIELVSELRFRRLLAIGNVAFSQTDNTAVDAANFLELYRMMIRIIHMLNGTCNLVSLANTVYWWNSKTKIELATYYFETNAAQK